MKENGFFDDAYTIIDANLNRAKEGLRVCEDIARFHLKSAAATKALGRLRHEITNTVKKSTLQTKDLIRTRDIDGDSGKTNKLGPSRKTYKAVFIANAQRTKEALRVLEEFSKLFDELLSRRLQRLRFKFYDLEKKIFSLYASLLDP